MSQRDSVRKDGFPTHAEVRERLDYDPETGCFRWKKLRRAILIGTIAGWQNKAGYRNIKFGPKKIDAHRLAWFYVYGEWPSGIVDHINGDPTDNRMVNLRLASDPQSAWNTKRRADNKSGFKGVFWNTQAKKWQAVIKRYGRRTHLGFHNNPEDAHAAYCEAAARLHGEFARFG